jgi:hypothetical protein
MSKITAKFDWKIVKINIVQFVLSLYCYLHAKYRIEQKNKEISEQLKQNRKKNKENKNKTKNSTFIVLM